MLGLECCAMKAQVYTQSCTTPSHYEAPSWDRWHRLSGKQSLEKTFIDRCRSAWSYNRSNNAARDGQNVSNNGAWSKLIEVRTLDANSSSKAPRNNQHITKKERSPCLEKKCWDAFFMLRCTIGNSFVCYIHPVARLKNGFWFPCLLSTIESIIVTSSLHDK